MELARSVKPVSRFDGLDLDYHALNAMLNLFDEFGKIQFDADKEAARQYFLQHVNQNTMFFHDLKEKIDYLDENDY
jgi:ribonucleoside-diphosphate reductase alpha chain